jgi:hypothetical protein
MQNYGICFANDLKSVGFADTFVLRSLFTTARQTGIYRAIPMMGVGTLLPERPLQIPSVFADTRGRVSLQQI